MNWRKATLWTAGTLILLGAAGVAAIHSIVDSEHLKKIAREKAQAAWGRDLAIGEMSLELWPLPALHAENVGLANPPGSKDPMLLRADSVTAELALLPLLIGKVRVKNLSLEGAKASIEFARDGTSSVPVSRANPSGENLDLEGLHIQDADIYYRPYGAPASFWHVDDARFEADHGLRDVRIDASLTRNQRPVKIKAELGDLSRVGVVGATTDGKLDLDWGKTRAILAGKIPLERSLKGHALTADLKSTSLEDMAGFLGDKRRATAPVEIHLESREAKGRIELTRIAGTLGTLKMSGDAQVTLGKSKPFVAARVELGPFDWARTMLDAGGPVFPQRPPDELFYDHPLAWPLLVALQGIEGKVDLTAAGVTLRNRVELRNLKAQSTFDGDRWNVTSFATEMLGGSATGNLQLEGRRKSARLTFNGTNLLLERWFKERGSKIAFTGGPMKVNATLSATGDSMKDLAATITGPVAIRMGPGVFASEKAGKAEEVMTGKPTEASAKTSNEIAFECASASFPFTAGRADGKAMLGARSNASLLLTSGTLDMREETIDLHGRLKPKSGVRLGLSALAGDVKISGKLRAPKMHLDPVGTPGAVARTGAAIATLGLSAVGTALIDAAATKNDPCEAVFAL
jgi:uncharacterized protein involved in outer membrane biogenesis